VHECEPQHGTVCFWCGYTLVLSSAWRIDIGILDSVPLLMPMLRPFCMAEVVILPLFQQYETMYNSVNCRTTAAGGAAASSHSATLDIAPGTAHTGVGGAPLAMAFAKPRLSLSNLKISFRKNRNYGKRCAAGCGGADGPTSG
jgi:hypothetical protein